MNKIIDQILDHYGDFNHQKKLIKTQIVRDHQFNIDQKFQIIDKIGKGSYSVFVAAICKDVDCSQHTKGQNQEDQKFKHIIAIKKMENIFVHLSYTKKALRQLRGYRLLKHPNILNLHTIQLPPSIQNFHQIYCIFEIMDTSLEKFLQQSEASLNEEHWRFFLYHILRALKYLHSAGVVHGNLSTKACLVNDVCDLKLCQFSQIMLISNTNRFKILMEDFDKLYYPAPEILLKDQSFNTAIDIWSVGCIFAQIVNRKPLFQKNNKLIQIYCDYIGNPSENSYSHLGEEGRFLIKNLRKHWRQPKKFTKLFPLLSDKAVDLMEKMLVFDSKKRISAEEALMHPYFLDLHSEECEPKRLQIQDLLIQFEFQNYSNITAEQFKKILFEEVLLYHSRNLQKEHHLKVKRKQSIMGHTHLKQQVQQNNQNLNKYIESLVDKGIKQQEKLFHKESLNLSIQSRYKKDTN